MNPYVPTEVLVADAVLAPSSHNTQPWRFKAVAGGVELHMDPTRRLPVNDPFDRELVISCGAALFNLLVSAEHHGWRADATFGPEDSTLIATVRLDPDHTPHHDVHELWSAIDRRSTWRKPFEEGGVPADVAGAIVAAAAAEGALALPVDDRARLDLAELVEKADEAQFSDPAWRHELASWMHLRRDGDGLPHAPVAAAVTRAVVSTLDLGARTATGDRRLVLEAPLLLVIATHDDDRAGWITAGMALEHILLMASAHGISAGFLNQPCQVAAVRPLLADLVGVAHPQLVLRLGHAPAQARRSPRRFVADVLVG